MSIVLPTSGLDARTSLYRYYDASDVLIYIGITGRGVARNAEHNKDKSWWPYVARQEVEHFTTREEALLAERRAITKHRPPFNKQHNPDHQSSLSAYLTLRVVAEVAEGQLTQTDKRSLRRRLPLVPLATPLQGHLVTLHSRPEDYEAIASAGMRPVLGPTEKIVVTAPGRSNSGRVCEIRFAGQMFIVGLQGKYLPPVLWAHGMVKISQGKPTGSHLIRVILNDPNLRAVSY